MVSLWGEVWGHIWSGLKGNPKETSQFLCIPILGHTHMRNPNCVSLCVDRAVAPKGKGLWVSLCGGTLLVLNGHQQESHHLGVPGEKKSTTRNGGQNSGRKRRPPSSCFQLLRLKHRRGLVHLIREKLRQAFSFWRLKPHRLCLEHVPC